MISQREIRYYASVPKVFVLFLGSLLFVAIGWWAWTTRHSMKAEIGGAAALVFFGICALTSLYWLACVVIFRKPLLEFNDAGVYSSIVLQPWRTIFVPWAQVESMGVLVQKMTRNKSYFFVVNVRDISAYRTPSSRLGRMTANMYPSLAHTAISVQLNSMYLFATRRKRAEMLERIKTTFMSEIIQHHIDLAMDERPMYLGA